MRADFRTGFIIYREGNKEPYYVTLHSGPALERPMSRDGNSETVASLSWLKTGGTLIVSAIPRKRAYGIDFNRDIPPKKEAIEIYADFVKDVNQKRLYEFRKKYAFAARDPEDYAQRLFIYKSFWNEVKKGFYISLVHTAYSRIKILPSIMDITVLSTKYGLKKHIIDIVEEVNSHYANFFKKVEKSYKRVVYLEEERAINNILRVYRTIGLDKIQMEFLENMKKDLEGLKRYCEESEIDILKENFTTANFLSLTKKALQRCEPPRVTVEHFFKGSKSIGPKKQLFPSDRIVLNFEPTTFLTFWHPHKGSEIMAEIITKILERLI